MKIINIDECTSTNIYLKNLISQKNDGKNYVVKTDFQSLGKGQGSNVWESENAKNLMFSFNSINHGLEAVNQFNITAIVSDSVCETISEYLPDETVKIKWPNDIYIGDKKIAGILIENDVLNNKITESVIGIGINVNQEIFKSNAPNPISLINLLGKEIDVNEVMNIFFNKFEKKYSLLKDENFNIIREEYLKKLFRINKEHLFIIDNKRVKGMIVGIDEFGFLQIKINNNIKSFDIKDVKYVF